MIRVSAERVDPAHKDLATRIEVRALSEPMPQQYRRFAPNEAALTQRWRTSATNSETWTLAGPVGRGVSNSFWIHRSDGLKAVAKPAFDNANRPQGAHERIAFALADQLELPVPPVQFWTDPGTGSLFSLSAFPFKNTLTWDQASPAMSQHFQNNILPMLASGYVFHAWIDDRDHQGNGGNILVDGDSDDFFPAIAFIDHAYSLSYQWTPGSGPCQPLSSYYCTPSDLPPETIADLVHRVQSLSDETIDGVVSEIPPQFLPSETAQLIRECLVRRKGELAAAFGTT